MPADAPEARQISGTAARDAGRRLRPVSHDGPRGLLQPRRSLDRRQRSDDECPAAAERTADGAELRADETARRTRHRVRGDAAVHPRQSQQPDRVDCRPERRAELRKGHRLQLSEDQARRRAAADRGAHRSERAAVGTALAVESAGFERAPRRSDRHPGRAGAALRRADLPAGRTQPDAGTAARRAGLAGPRRLRSELRDGAGGALRQRPSMLALDPAASQPAPPPTSSNAPARPAPSASPPGAPASQTSTRSSPKPRAISPTISG